MCVCGAKRAQTHYTISTKVEANMFKVFTMQITRRYKHKCRSQDVNANLISVCVCLVLATNMILVRVCVCGSIRFAQ